MRGGGSKTPLSSSFCATAHSHTHTHTMSGQNDSTTQLCVTEPASGNEPGRPPVLLPDNFVFLFTSSSSQPPSGRRAFYIPMQPGTSSIPTAYASLKKGRKSILDGMLSQVYGILMHCQAALYCTYINKQVKDDQKQQVISKEINLHISHAKAITKRI